MRHTFPRRAFSLLELLVVMGVSVLLMALVLPAIQRVREAANMTICKDRLRQLGLAAHGYHAATRHLPPGYLGPSLRKNTDYPALFNEGQWVGHFPLLVPYLEKDVATTGLSVSFQPAAVTRLPWFWRPGPVAHTENYMAGMTPVRLFRCPSATDFLPEVGNVKPGHGGTQLGLHVFNSKTLGPFTAGWKDDYVRSAPYRFLAKTNYMGVAGCGSGDHPIYSRYEGIYTNRTQRTLGQISAKDGTANTLLYGESCGTVWDGNPSETMDICWVAGGGLGTYLGLQRAPRAPLIGFSSPHRQGVQFCFADGSVRIIRYGSTRQGGENPSRDWLLLQQLAGWRDGARDDVSLLVE